MAAERIAPIDPITQLPALIAPRCETLPLNKPEIADRHHLWRPSSVYRGLSVAGIALRSSLIQIVERDLHNEGPDAFHYHYVEPQVITDEDEIFRRIIPACSGVVPQLVVSIHRGEIVERSITPNELSFIKTPSVSNPARYMYLQYREEPIRDFLRAQVFKQSISHIRNGLIDEFLHTKNQARKLSIGKFLLYNAAGVASDPVREDYFRLRRAGHIHPLMPKEVQQLVYNKLGSVSRQSRLLRRYEDKLAQAA